MFHEVILERKENIKNYYFRSKAIAKEDEPSEFIEYKKKDTLKFIDEINKISGIYKDEECFKQYIRELMPGSFGLRLEFELASSYFSRDDDEFYAVPNPVLKEHICKVPMIRGSSWKGILSFTGFKVINEKLHDDNIPIVEILNNYMSMVRIFGTGSENFRNIEKALDDFIKESGKEKEEFIKCLMKYALFDLGIDIRINKNGESVVEQILDQIRKNEENKNKAYGGFLTRKGRAIFYPTYFNKLGFEVINLHDKKKRAGKSPIFFEIVPKGAKGIFQMAYIPFDGVLETKEILENQQKMDFEFSKTIIERTLSEKGIGAKTKIGWGRVKGWEKIRCLK